jgi:hypothetical protein
MTTEQTSAPAPPDRGCPPDVWDAAVKAAAEAAPPLTDEQRARVRAILNPIGGAR